MLDSESSDLGSSPGQAEPLCSVLGQDTYSAYLHSDVMLEPVHIILLGNHAMD